MFQCHGSLRNPQDIGGKPCIWDCTISNRRWGLAWLNVHLYKTVSSTQKTHMSLRKDLIQPFPWHLAGFLCERRNTESVHHHHHPCTVQWYSPPTGLLPKWRLEQFSESVLPLLYSLLQFFLTLLLLSNLIRGTVAASLHTGLGAHLNWLQVVNVYIPMNCVHTYTHSYTHTYTYCTKTASAAWWLECWTRNRQVQVQIPTQP